MRSVYNKVETCLRAVAFLPSFIIRFVRKVINGSSRSGMSIVRSSLGGDGASSENGEDTVLKGEERVTS